MLIDIGRVSGNLKNRMVTITTMRNAFKMMGARLVKGESGVGRSLLRTIPLPMLLSQSTADH